MSYDSPYCVDCDRYFPNWFSRDQHFRDAAVHREAGDWNGDQSQGYYNYYDAEEGVEDELDGPYCHGCRRWFYSMNDFDRHFATSSRHNWCSECSKDFSSPHALQQHQSSRVHAARDFDCPLCGQGFKQPSAIAHHVESGSCPRAPGVDRHQVSNAVHNLNIAPTISVSRRITGGPPSALITYTATDRAWNYDVGAYECYLCHRTFAGLNALNTHLNSPAHDRDEFRCPKAQCGRQFKVISALVQHIESEACGLARFQQIEDHTRALTSQFPRMLTY